MDTSTTELEALRARCEKAERERDELQDAARIQQAASAELVELLREYWKSPDVDPMTLFLSAIVAGIADKWAENPPQNGIVNQSVWPNLGAMEIQIRKMPDGKSAAQSINELQKALGECVERGEKLANAMETCHICAGVLVVEEGPSHCENCSGDCEDHEEPECPMLYTLHNELKKALAQAQAVLKGEGVEGCR